MNFRNLPPNVQDGIRALTTDEEFQYRFGHDKILDEIDEMKTNMKDEYISIQLLLTNKLKIDDKFYKPLTIGIWSFLWVIDSPFVNYEKEIEENDVDVFLYLLDNGMNDADNVNIITEAMGYTPNKLKIDYTEALTLINSIIKISFKPLNLFPSTKSSGKSIFDGDWMTSLATKVYAVTGYDMDYILNTLSLHACCYYFAQYARMNGSTEIYKRTPEELLKMSDNRASELVIERLIEKNVINADEKDKYYKIITTPQKKNK